ncbi:hypothetical protein KY290_024759 [Solanum tuberosum]|uniref:Uncharacterized protein n=1 Tax=Solanum tuberosum TaxID=4113 RepID=A0ABQ7URU7_SOLTU|nr:hypothetical protein KY284_023614 [Solanum tuberosum]KAH0754489.1 hypothetical protein KY290_024759 [Solanum tuberosum]
MSFDRSPELTGYNVGMLTQCISMLNEKFEQVEIQSLADSNIKLTDPVQMEHEFITFFKNLIGAKTDLMPYLDSPLTQRGKCLTYQQKGKLITNVTYQEIKDSVYAMPHEKALGVDGFPVELFTTNWTIVEEGLNLAVKEFFNSGKLLKSFSCSVFITLIPKVALPLKIEGLYAHCMLHNNV